MSTELSLRGWQTRFVKDIRAHRGKDYLLVACPAAGKTLAAGVAAAEAMRVRKCNQLVVIVPTVVVRQQWIRELERLGFSMLSNFEDGWPDYVHGVVSTYAQLARRGRRFAEMIERRRTVAVFDEVHHAGSDLSWGAALQKAFSAAELRLLLSGTPFRSDEGMIPFTRYDADGRCIADFGYDYQEAIRNGVCRPVVFHPHDGAVTWRQGSGDEEEERTAMFSSRVKATEAPRRLRASLDPSKLYLRSLLYAANHDLSRLRRHVPNAAGLVVADSQAHAAAIDTVLREIAGEPPTIVMSDIPRAHQAIEAFADEHERWLLSVRMVSEGVDIPRLAVIVWATAATTELMVRQVSGRAMRGRAEYAKLPAIVHMPADPELMRYAERIDVLGGVSRRGRADRWYGGKKSNESKGLHKGKMIDPTPFVRWFDRMVGNTDEGGTRGLGHREMMRRCGWGETESQYQAMTRRLYGWRTEGRFADPLLLFDACHLAGVDFNELFKAQKYAEVRAWIEDPTLLIAAAGRKLDFRTVDARPVDDAPLPIAPHVALPAAALHSEEMISVSTPALPPSPKEVRETVDRARAKRSELLRLLNTYAALQRMVNPAYQGALAHVELARDVGRIGPDTPERKVDEAVGWVRDKLRVTAREHPDEFKELAGLHRRQELSRGAAGTEKQASQVA